jgi:LPS-assembly protein
LTLDALPRPDCIRRTPVAIAVAIAFAASVANAADEAPLPPLQLKLAPALVPPPIRPATSGAPGAPPSRAPAAPGAAVPLRLTPIGAEGGVVFLRADSVTGVGEKFVEAQGNVELRTRRETVLADWLRYDFGTDEVWGKGNVLIRRGVDWITGPEARYTQQSELGFFTEPRFYIGENGGRGSAEELRFVGPEKYEATDARYTTCVAPREDWYLHIDELQVDQSRMVATGRGATLNFLGANVAYSPWVSFPLSNERKSGFLTPIFGSSGTRGFEVIAPYYLNLAPNYDATVAPRVMTKRGLALAGQFRYLFTGMSGELDGEILPHDRIANADRYAISWKHNETFAAVPGLAGYLNLNKVSDDTYFADLADRVSVTSQSTLPREGGVTYTRGPWSLLARAQSFQTLAQPNTPTVPPYNRLPQLTASLAETEYLGLDFNGATEYVQFRQAALPTPSADRFFVYPSVIWQRQGAAWFFRAKTGVHYRAYSIDSNATLNPPPDSIHVTTPISSVDGGLVFERDAEALGTKFVQTLEPRAYYVYIPYRNQSDIPVFDTALDDFNFGQLFSENRYLGEDRIGDANQLSLALTSRILDPESGAERLRVAVGQRFYFTDQRVVLSEQPRSARTSDVLIGAEGRLTDTWSLAGLLQYNTDASTTERSSVGVKYAPDPGKVIAATYTFQRNVTDILGAASSRLEQFDVATQWPITSNWTLLGRWNYSLADRKTLEGLLGFEYNADCWVLRVVGQRLTTTTTTTTSSVYVQIELNGLARFGTNPLDLLRRSIPGYLRSNEPSLQPRERGGPFPEY